ALGEPPEAHFYAGHRERRRTRLALLRAIRRTRMICNDPAQRHDPVAKHPRKVCQELAFDGLRCGYHHALGGAMASSNHFSCGSDETHDARTSPCATWPTS